MGNRVFIGNLSYQATENDIRQAFEDAGVKALDVRVILDRETQRPRGFAFASVAGPAELAQAVERIDGQPICGRAVVAREAEERTFRGPRQASSSPEPQPMPERDEGHRSGSRKRRQRWE